MSEFLNKAITAHSAWKGKLRTAIEGGEVPDAAKTRADNQCDLGKWIHGEGASHQSLSEYQQLKTDHANFHSAAANVIDLIKKGNKTQASTELDSGAFARASEKVVASITGLRKKLG
jgi:hypothetical protein